jgi:hypothetical protein
MHTAPTQISTQQAEQALTAVRAHFDPWIFDGEEGPHLIAPDTEHPYWTIQWASTTAPYDWAHLAQYGGIDEALYEQLRLDLKNDRETALRMSTIHELPDIPGVSVEACAGHILGLHPDVVNPT